jgi:dTMP kinase
MKHLRFFDLQPPEVTDTKASGHFFVIEGADGSGRSTQIELLTGWLESQGFAVKHMGLRRSNLVGEELEEAKQGNILNHTTMSLFYATDLFDQLINEILPALRAGYIVLSDRYIYTLMARDIVRGADRDWVANVFRTALVPDAVFYFKIGGRQLLQRNFSKNTTLDYWESGMDLGLSREMFDSFIKYQRLIQAEFKLLAERNGFDTIDANRPLHLVQRELRAKIGKLLGLA